MDGLTFISDFLDSCVWPLLVLVAILILKEPIGDVIKSIKKIKHGATEIEFEEANISANAEVNSLISYLNKGAHSFKWFRDHTTIKYSDEQFEKIISENSKFIKRVTIVRRDNEGNRISPGLPGIKLTKEAIENLDK